MLPPCTRAPFLQPAGMPLRPHKPSPAPDLDALPAPPLPGVRVLDPARSFSCSSAHCPTLGLSACWEGINHPKRGTHHPFYFAPGSVVRPWKGLGGAVFLADLWRWLWLPLPRWRAHPHTWPRPPHRPGLLSGRPGRRGLSRSWSPSAGFQSKQERWSSEALDATSAASCW